MLADSNFGPADALTGEAAEFAGRVRDDAVTGGMDGKVGTQHGTVAGALGQADLADDDLAGLDSLAAEELDAEALAFTVAGIFGGTAGFDM